MQQRMYNTFFRLIKNRVMAKILAKVGYGILMIYYCVVRCFYRRKSNQKDVTVTVAKDARERLYELYYPQDMHCDIINQTVDEKVDLSIVLPVYNGEDYIGEAIRSILSQKTTYRYELIVVNDGSTDRTDEVVRQIQNDKIKYIKQENRGHSGARNTGIDAAVGKYLCFVDADDILCEGSIEKMLEVAMAEDADVVVGGYYHFFENHDKKQYFVRPYEVMTRKEQMVGNPGYPWGKIYRRDLFSKVRFPLGAWFEDTIICTVIYRMCQKIVVIPEVVYGYRQNPGSVTRNARKSVKALDHLWVMENAIEQSEVNGLTHDEVLYHLVFSHMSTLLYRRISLMDEENIRDAFYVACDMLQNIRPKAYEKKGRMIEKDLEQAFETGNYKLWKLASFII